MKIHTSTLASFYRSCVQQAKPSPHVAQNVMRSQNNYNTPHYFYTRMAHTSASVHSSVNMHTPNSPIHVTATANHYDTNAKNYDKFNTVNAKEMNNTVAALIQAHMPDCRTILDITCGTGEQVFDLSARGYNITGSDINLKMLEVAKNKAIQYSPNLYTQFHQADMRSVQLGSFDSMISMFNAVGHLTRSDFEKAMLNTAANLVKGGIYIFDIFNASYLRTGDNITKLTIDWVRHDSTHVIRDVQYSDINNDGVLTSYTVSYDTDVNGQCTVSKHAQTLQVYTSYELNEMLEKCGFEVIEQCGINREEFSDTETERIFTTAKLI